MQFDDGRAAFLRALDLLLNGVDEQAHGDVLLLKGFDGPGNAVEVAYNVEPSFRRDLGPLFRDQRRFVRFDQCCDRDDLFVQRHLEVQPRRDGFSQPADIIIVDMTAVFAQMRNNTVGPGLLADLRGDDRIGIELPPGLAKGSDVINIDSEFWHWLKE